MGTPAKYYEAYKKSYPKLISALPIDDMLSYLVAARVLPGRVKARMDAVPVCSDKVKLMLDEMEGGLQADIPDQFECLIKVMEQFSVDEDHIVVRKLAENVRMIVTSGDTPAEGLPVSPIATLPQVCAMVHVCPLCCVAPRDLVTML